ncbi:MAG: MmcQ/YjbR family DNA-binding protein [Azoarcus sp.]|jgi:predicted DNA-binding protein (MmcQ/YjbR family)|nr:MmcQ/YjbR family DNA-binding protein [Azoarcus sp.]
MTGTLFKNRKVRIERLLPFGFSESEGAYVYSKSIVDGQFEVIVTITKEGEVSAGVIDSLSREPYVLHRVPDATGSFVGRVREEYGSVLSTIDDACFEFDVFKSENAKEVIRYVREKYQDELQFLWKRFPDNAILRRQDNAKWYAALLILHKKKLGLNAEGMVDIINLRVKPESLDSLVDGKRYFPGFHMNKKHWITICLDGSVSIEEIFSRIDDSFALAMR